MGIGVAVPRTAGSARDRGSGRRHTPHDVIVDVAVSPVFASDSTVLTISDNRVLRSTDGGRHFRETLAGLDPTVPMARFGFAPSEPRVVYLDLTRRRGLPVRRRRSALALDHRRRRAVGARRTSASRRDPRRGRPPRGHLRRRRPDRRRRTLVDRRCPVCTASGRSRSCPTGTIVSSPATGAAWCSSPTTTGGRSGRARHAGGHRRRHGHRRGTGGAVFAGMFTSCGRHRLIETEELRYRRY